MNTTCMGGVKNAECLETANEGGLWMFHIIGACPSETEYDGLGIGVGHVGVENVGKPSSF